ncbi:SET domain-containing protein [Microcoleus sp. FACHB-1515]|uniref:SET domain-containing protein-lysine N-methyltransferase n=1 Tax=Cyanophyceae TaxID=3028117 RepID=UPI001683F7BF|nr:SET domain-containing methyltransferase [Microcoleus sp. FACHB-1515]MBD2092036.1 SET domain-containing protein [Microcoleus sp. FACHB-1515]
MTPIMLDRTTRTGKRAVAAIDIAQGTTIHHIRHYQIRHTPTYTSVQLSANLHIEELYLASLNHSCDPNVLINLETLELQAIRDIAVGEELSFFYPSTEWEMDAPFDCLCQSPRCLKRIAGAKYLSIETLSQYTLNRHICVQIFSSLAQASQFVQAA